MTIARLTRLLALPVCLALAVLATARAARATPILGEPLAAGPLRVFADDADPTLWYYPPGPLAVAEAPGGGPDVRFLQLVYVGREVSGDPGRFVAKSVLSFRVHQQAVAAADLAAARAALPPGARLRALPLRRSEAQVVWTPLAAEATGSRAPEAAGPRPLGEVRLEEAEAPSPAGDTWAERVFVLGPDPHSSQLLWDALQRGSVALSLGWTHWAEGVDRPRVEVTGAPGLALADAARPASTAPSERVVGSGAFPLEIDARRFPDRFRRFDLNQSLPPGFAILEVRCYDFDNALRPDLARKAVEVRAAGVRGRTVVQTVTFRPQTPHVAAATVRFPQAVRLDRPFQWRTVEVTTAGEVRASPWAERTDWISLLDATSPAEARPALPSPIEDVP
ncbi:MAG TPA: hypothetical protein VEB43_09385 [Anaeromyxobacter sp.]|nr:hypothetical protein [Anaeromyxobacter sp.]